MNDRTKQFRVGVVVFATLLITGLLIVLTSDISWAPFQSQYQIKVLVDQAPGVAPETPVRRRGILIGRVEAVDDTDEGALITINVDEGKQVKTNELARIQTSLIGDAVIDFTPVGPTTGAQPVPPGATVNGMYNPNPMELLANLQGDLKITINALGRAGDEVAMLADRMNQVLGEPDVDRLNRLVTNTERAMGQFASAMDNVNDILGDEQFKQQLKEGLETLPMLVQDIEALLKVLETAVASADQNLRNLQGLTDPLGERGPAIVGNIERSVQNLSILFEEGSLLVKSINTSEGTLGRLIRDRKISDDAEATLANVNQAIYELRAVLNDGHINRRLRQILDDVRIFADKIARDPGRLARGVIQRETPIKNEPLPYQR